MKILLNDILDFEFNDNIAGFIKKNGEFELIDFINTDSIIVKKDHYSNILKYGNKFTLYNDTNSCVFDSHGTLLFDEIYNYVPFINYDMYSIGTNKFGLIGSRMLPSTTIWESRFSFTNYILKDNLYFIYKDFSTYDSIICLDPKTGVEIWAFQLNSKYDKEINKKILKATIVSMFIYEDNLYISTDTGYLISIDFNGKLTDEVDFISSNLSLEISTQILKNKVLRTIKFDKSTFSLSALAGYKYLNYDIQSKKLEIFDLQNQFLNFNINYASLHNIIVQERYVVFVSDDISKFPNNIGVFDISSKEIIRVFNTNIDSQMDSYGNYCHPSIRKIRNYGTELFILDYNRKLLKTEKF